MGHLATKPTISNIITQMMISKGLTDYFWSESSIQYYFGNVNSFTYNAQFGTEFSNHFTGIPDSESAFKLQIGNAINMMDDYLGISISSTGSISDAELIIFSSGTPRHAEEGFFNFPGTPGTGNDGNYTSVGAFNSSNTDLKAVPEKGGGEYLTWTLIHEIGHSLGLNHTHYTKDDVNYAWDQIGEGLNNERYSVMSYNGATAATEYGHAVTLMALDIAGLQALYGKSSYASGHSSYALTDPKSATLKLDENAVSIGRAYYCIYDSGGTDEISYSGASAALINLNAATLDRSTPLAEIQEWITELKASSVYASLSTSLKASLVDSNYFAGGFFSQILTGKGADSVNGIDGGFSIANGSVIENAIGGSGADILIGNAADNTIEGNKGDDFLFGAYGGDTLRGNDGDDILQGGTGNDTLTGGVGSDVSVYSGNFDSYTLQFNANGTVSISDANGSDTLTEIETAKFSDREIDLRPGQDIAFVIDTTGSMDDDIDAVKASAAAIIDAIFDADHGLIDSHFAIVGFNDPNTETILSFTTNSNPNDRKQSALNAINSITVGGGGDWPEMVNSGLIRALDGSAGAWRADAASRRIVLFGDAPPKDTELADQVRIFAANLNATVEGHASSVAMSSSLYMTNFMLADEGGEPVRVQIFTVVIGGDSETIKTFGSLATDTGGVAYSAAGAEDIVDTIIDVIRTPLNNAPVVSHQISDQYTYDEPNFYFIIPGKAFDDPDGDLLTYSVTLEDGRDIPSWMTFDPMLRKLQGSPGAGDVGNYSIKVTASDGEESVFDTFDLEIRPVVRSRGRDIMGSSGANFLKGTDLGELLNGKGGNDRIYGAGGNDDIIGGLGRDILQGGTGADTFNLRSVSESPWKDGKFDLIKDFNGRAGDKIDLSFIDASSRAGYQSFRFVGKSNTYSDQGEIDYLVKDGHTYIYGYTDADTHPEIFLVLEDAVRLNAGNFIL